MIITCNECDTRFNLDESFLKQTGSKVRCAKCKNIFTAYPSSLSEESDKSTEVETKLEAAITDKEIESNEQYKVEEAATEFQIEIAHKTIDSGADMIIGHHPHVLQDIEFYKNKPIIYSLGNLVFDQAFGDTPKSAIIKCVFNKDGLKKIDIIPIMRTYDKYYPQPAEGKQKQEIINQILGLGETRDEGR